MENFKLDFERLHHNAVDGTFLTVLPHQTSPAVKDKVTLVLLVDFSLVPENFLGKTAVPQYNMEKLKEEETV